MNDDGYQILQGTDFPISSFGLYGIVGSTGSGKTYQAFKLQDQYFKVSNKQYNINQPQNILNVPYTHCYYVSGTDVAPPQQTNPKQPQWSLCDSSTLEQTTESIIELTDIYNGVRDLQQFILNLTGQEDIYQIQKIIKLIEQTKLRVPSLLFNYPSATLTALYKLLGSKYDGYLVRRPKIAMIIDDSSGEKYWSTTSNNFLFRFLSRRRHYGVFNTSVLVHSMSVLYGQFKELFSAYLIFRDVNTKHIKILFEDTLGFEKYNFKFDDFDDIYKRHTGFKDDIFDNKHKQTDQHNFIYIMRQPEKHMYLNFDNKMF